MTRPGVTDFRVFPLASPLPRSALPVAGCQLPVAGSLPPPAPPLRLLLPPPPLLPLLPLRRLPAVLPLRALRPGLRRGRHAGRRLHALPLPSSPGRGRAGAELRDRAPRRRRPARAALGRRLR